MKSKLICVILIITIVMSAFELYVFATSKSELNNQSSQLDNQINEKKNEIDEKNDEISSAMSEVKELMAEIATYETEISNLSAQINSVTNQINETQNNIKQKEKELTEKQELLDKRLVAIYESGNTSYLEMLLTSADLSDFISKYYLISEIAEYDTDLINSIKSAKAELEVSKAGLEENKNTLETAKAEQVQKQKDLQSVKAQKDKKVAALNAEEKELQSELEVIEREKQKIVDELAAIARKEEEDRKRREEEARKNGTTVSTAPSSYGYIFPIPGLSKANINKPWYPSYKGHTGVDVNIGVSGKAVVAVKSGTVVKSAALKIGGYYISYGEYVVINHHDGTMTWYGHMKEGSRLVTVGQEVSQGQQIGTVGSTGNSSGDHLHFEVRINNRAVNPLPYLP